MIILTQVFYPLIRKIFRGKKGREKEGLRRNDFKNNF